MAKELTAANKRDAELLLAILRLIRDNGNSMRYADIKNEFPQVFTLTEREREPKNTWKEFWHAILQMVGGIELKQVGIVDIKKGVWSVTSKGEKLLNTSPEEFYHAFHFPYLELVKQRKQEIITSDSVKPIDSIENIHTFDIGAIQSKARERIQEYIIKKDPYQFQDFVAALLRGMGYFIPYIAPKGKDGGIDIVAHEDPLGVKGRHIKVQVKHEPNKSQSVDVVRSLSGVLSKSDDVGIFATSGRFSKECYFESRRGHTPIRLLDLDELTNLWIQFYPNMTDDDKAELPITPVYHLNTDKI